MKSDRVVYLDILRIVATLAVIILHTAASQWYKTPVNTYNWQVFNIYDSLVRWCVPIFLMISGVFFLDNSKNLSRINIYTKYIKRVVIALAFWGVLYGFISLLAKSFINNDQIFLMDIVKIFAKFVFGPPWYHLWFLYLIIGIYMLTPLFRVFTSNSKKEEIEYLLILFGLFGLLLPMVKNVLVIIDPRFEINFSIVELTGYVGYFFAGYYFNKYEISKKIKIFIYIMGLFSVFFTIIITVKWSLMTGEPQAYLYGYLLPTTMFEAYALFILFKERLSSIKYSKKIEKNLSFLSGCTFGIYLVHDFINQAYSILNIYTTTLNPVIMIPIMSVITFIISFVIIIAIKQIPYINKNVI